MKTKSNIKALLTTALIALCTMTFSSVSKAQAQTNTNLKEFKITIERTDKGLKMQSSRGSAWIDLGFSLAKNKPQAIDEYGMTQLGKVAANRDPNLANYLFTITKTKDAITLISMEGAAWKELSFSLPKNGKQSIDQFGMTD